MNEIRFSINSKDWGELYYTAKLINYFSITGQDKSFTHKNPNVAGCIHDELKNTYWNKFVKWHLFTLDKGPMHYIANALYWLQFTKPYTPKQINNFQIFLDHIVRGETKFDTFDVLEELRQIDSRSYYGEETHEDKEYVINFLNERFNDLNNSFIAAMIELKLLKVNN